jgi:Uma2 family endonuclease
MTTKLAYNYLSEIDYGSLDYDPDEREPLPDSMYQDPILQELLHILSGRYAGSGRSPDNFLGSNTILCYDPANLNRRVSPDCYMALGVDVRAIRRRKLYLPWEVGKPPDWVLEIASESTSRVDVNRKPGVYAQIGVPEYWRFDPTGGRYHGEPLAGGRLVNDVYRSVELTTEPDGILKGYSEVLELSLSWDEGWPRLYDPKTGAYLENWQQQMSAAEVERAVLEAERDAARAENERLREELRRLQSEN